MRITRLLFLFPFFLGAATLAAQNPLARTQQDLFAGIFQNEQMKLELERAGTEYKGIISLGGQSLPVKATAAAGRLSGTFASNGQSYSFEAVRDGVQLTLTTDGTTHVLRAPGAPVTPSPGTAGVVGVWQSPTGIVRINPDGTAMMADKPSQWSLDGSVITFTGGGERVHIPFDLNGNAWTWKLPTGKLEFTRMADGGAAAAPAVGAIAGAWQGPTGMVQINPDGTAAVGGVPYRYSYMGDQLTLTGPDGTFVATVQQGGDTMTWTVNGKAFSFQRNAQIWAVGGGNGAILPELVGKWCQGNAGPSACISLLADGSFQYASETGASGRAGGDDSGTWTATGTTITANSRKTGARTVRLEKRNHPKTGEPMIVLDGEAYTSAFKKDPWR